ANIPVGKVVQQEQIDDQIRRLQSSWSQAARTAVTLNHEYIANRDDDFRRSVEVILKQDDVVGAALQQLRSAIHEVSSSHLRFVYLGVVARALATSRNRARQDVRFLARRAPLQLTEDLFYHLIGSKPTDDFLDQLYRNKDDVP